MSCQHLVLCTNIKHWVFKSTEASPLMLENSWQRCSLLTDVARSSFTISWPVPLEKNSPLKSHYPPTFNTGDWVVFVQPSFCLNQTHLDCQQALFLPHLTTVEGCLLKLFMFDFVTMLSSDQPLYIYIFFGKEVASVVDLETWWPQNHLQSTDCAEGQTSSNSGAEHIYSN